MTPTLPRSLVCLLVLSLIAALGVPGQSDADPPCRETPGLTGWTPPFTPTYIVPSLVPENPLVGQTALIIYWGRNAPLLQTLILRVRVFSLDGTLVEEAEMSLGAFQPLAPFDGWIGGRMDFPFDVVVRVGLYAVNGECFQDTPIRVTVKTPEEACLP